MNPNGGYIYPVTLYPEDWFTLLDTSFTAVDLLESPAALSQKLNVLEMQKSNLTANINQFLQVIPDDQSVADLKNKYDACEDAFKGALNAYISTNASATVDMFKTLVDIIASNSPDPSKPDTQSVSNESVARIFGVDVSDVSKIMDALGNNITSCIEAQNSLADSSNKAVTAAMDYFTSNNMLQLKGMLQPLQQQLDEVNEKIAELKQQIALASAMQPKTEADKDGVIAKPDKSLVAPNEVPDRFTQIIIDSSLSSANKQSAKSSSSSQSSYGVSFFFGGYSCNSSHNEAVDNELSNNENMEIQIGMSVAKVTIDREWFNPGVFMLSSDMYNTSSEHISPSDETSFHDSNPAAVSKYMDEMNDCIFSCYPTAFVIAKDVTIKFVDQKAISTAFAQSVEEHSSKGGGFFIFGGSSSSSSSSSASASTATSSANSVTVRFTAPQILGYYLEAVAPDKSTPISNTNNSDADYISIFEFIETFKKMLDDHNAKYHKDIMNA
jgi:DNA-binding transcriptional MerR regulator